MFDIVRAYLEADQPDQGLKPYASFNDWSNYVRSALVWLGEPDPRATAEEMRREDPGLLLDKRIFLAWKNAVGLDKPMFVSELLSLTGADSSNTSGNEDFNFAQAISELSRDGHGVSAGSFGHG